MYYTLGAGARLYRVTSPNTSGSTVLLGQGAYFTHGGRPTRNLGRSGRRGTARCPPAPSCTGQRPEHPESGSAPGTGRRPLPGLFDSPGARLLFRWGNGRGKLFQGKRRCDGPFPSPLVPWLDRRVSNDVCDACKDYAGFLRQPGNVAR